MLKVLPWTHDILRRGASSTLIGAESLCGCWVVFVASKDAIAVVHITATSAQNTKRQMKAFLDTHTLLLLDSSLEILHHRA